MEIRVNILFMNEFHSMLKTTGLWTLIPNLETKDYRRNRHLIQKYETTKNQ